MLGPIPSECGRERVEVVCIHVGVMDMPPQIYGIMSRLFSSDDKVSQQAESDLLSFHPGAQVADRVKEAVHDWRRSKSLAAKTWLVMRSVSSCSTRQKMLPEAKLKQLEAEGTVLPPELKPKAPAAMPKAHPEPPTIEGKFERVAPSAVQPIDAAANLKRVEPPNLPEVKAEAAK